MVGLESIASSYSALLYGIIGLLILAVVCHKWDAIVFFITEQPKLHISLLDYFHCFYRWTCGCCCGAWTRSFTSCCCGTCAKCDYCGCGCESVAGLPVSSMFGSVIGIIPRVIEVSDLVVGDLPFSGLGDFYITMETGSNPRQASSVMKDSIPKVTHFADKMILCVRDSVFERRVEFVVWELNVAGAERLCDVQLSARQLIDWALASTSSWASARTSPLDRSIARSRARAFGVSCVPSVSCLVPDAGNVFHAAALRAAGGTAPGPGCAQLVWLCAAMGEPKG